jgi:hypothetical protein
MSITPHAAWRIRRLLSVNEPVNGELSALPSPYDLVAVILAKTAFDERGDILDAFLAGRIGTPSSRPWLMPT